MPCPHAGAIRQVEPSPDGCEDCLGTSEWKAVVIYCNPKRRWKVARTIEFLACPDPETTGPGTPAEQQRSPLFQMLHRRRGASDPGGSIKLPAR
jgi:hypothetical protein